MPWRPRDPDVHQMLTFCCLQDQIMLKLSNMRDLLIKMESQDLNVDPDTSTFNHVRFEIFLLPEYHILCSTNSFSVLQTGHSRLLCAVEIFGADS